MDFLDDLLQPVTPATPDPVARARLCERTTREVRRQRRRRRLAGVAALLGAYAAGLLTVFAFRPPDSLVERPMAVAKRENKAIKPIPDLEWEAIEKPAQAATLYRTAGDRYLEEEDPANAVRCYGNALDAAPTDGAAINPEDNWLLMAIKLARKEENKRCEK